jgi:2-keto-3-deoxy-6-phosphogluconate aldolase
MAEIPVECVACGDWFYPAELHANGVCDGCEKAAKAAVRAAERRAAPWWH